MYFQSPVISLCGVYPHCVQSGSQLPDEEGPAHLFLAKHHLKNGAYKEAEAHAHKCTEYEVVSKKDRTSTCTSMCTHRHTQAILITHARTHAHTHTHTRTHTRTHTHTQTREEGKSLLQEASKWGSLLESGGLAKGLGLDLPHPEEELSPITSHTIKQSDPSSN